MALDSPGCLWLLLVLPLFLGGALFSIRGAVRWRQAFTRRPVENRCRYLETGLLALCIAGASVGLARPRIQVEREVFSRSGVEILLGIDVSKSMLAEDVVLPGDGGGLFRVANRLNAARLLAIELLSLLKGERVGVFLFAQGGVEVVPLTRDYGFCRYILTYINEREITRPGSDLAEAIRKGISIFEDEGGRAARVLVLFTDGEDLHLETSAFLEAAGRAAAKGIHIFTVGIGSPGGVMIPVRSPGGTEVVSYYTDEEGVPLKTRLERRPLETIAGVTGGRYFSGREGRLPKVLLRAVLEKVRNVAFTREVEQAWVSLSPLFLLGGFALFGGAVWLGR